MSNAPASPAAASAKAEIPFPNAEEAWFWSIQAAEAAAAGARCVAGLGLVARPCEPGDVARAIDRLFRQRRLVRDHLEVLIHFGRRQLRPDPVSARDSRSCALWREAFARITPVLRAKGIVQ